MIAGPRRTAASCGLSAYGTNLTLTMLLASAELLDVPSRRRSDILNAAYKWLSAHLGTRSQVPAPYSVPTAPLRQPVTTYSSSLSLSTTLLPFLLSRSFFFPPPPSSYNPFLPTPSFSTSVTAFFPTKVPKSGSSSPDCVAVG